MTDPHSEDRERRRSSFDDDESREAESQSQTESIPDRQASNPEDQEVLGKGARDASAASDSVAALESDQIVDWEEARRLIPGGTEVLVELVQAVQSECQTLLNDLDESVASQDAKKMTRAAHTLKSSARYLGAHRVVDLAWKLEEIGRREALEEVPSRLEELKVAVDLMLQELTRWLEEKRDNDGSPAHGKER